MWLTAPFTSLSTHVLQQEAVAEVPRTFQEFQNILLPRIRPDPELHALSVEDQQSLVGCAAWAGTGGGAWAWDAWKGTA